MSDIDIGVGQSFESKVRRPVIYTISAIVPF
jgi:hypothetical protein